MRGPRALVLTLLCATLSPRMRAQAAPLELTVLDNGTLGSGWKDLGWAVHELVPGKPVRVDFSGSSGWILAHERLKPDFLGLLIRLRAPASYGDFLEVNLDSRSAVIFPRVRMSGAARAVEADGWFTLWLPMTALDPAKEPFDRVTLRATAAVGVERVEIARIALAVATPSNVQSERGGATPAVRQVQARIDCRQTHPISPLIYGVLSGEPAIAADTSATAYRWGGNTRTRYNFKLDAWNTGSDYYFRNVKADRPGLGWKAFVESARAEHRQIAFTLPIIGWVAKDAISCGFPASRHPQQHATDPYLPVCGDGLSPDGSIKLMPGPPGQTSIAIGPEWTQDWTRQLRAAAGPALSMYMLDNEPTLWNSTHRDLHPAQVTYEELLQLTLESSAAIRVADPGARIAGFTGWGYSSIFDTGDGRGAAPTERARQVDTALLPWWLAKLKEHDRKTGKRSVDYVDMHFYPQGANIGMGANGGTDTETAMRRIRSVRALWDPSYKDESWINDAQQLIPRLRRLIAQGYPGLGIVIGEYNFGGEKHISGALALAETLGRFGVLGVDGAFYFSWPEKGSLAAWAFKAFRNYDGKGAAFGNESIEVAADPDPLASVFASRAPDGKLVLIALNSDPERGLELKIDGKLCGSPSPGRNFTLSGADGLQPDPAVRDGGRYRLRPWSISVIELNPPAKK